MRRTLTPLDFEHKNNSQLAQWNGEGVTTYDEWAGFLKVSIERKADISMTKLEDVGGGVIEYKAALIYPGKDPIHFASRGEFKDGQLFKVSPL